MPTELNVSISEGLMDKLNSLASDTQRSREELVEAAVERLVADEGPWVATLHRRLHRSNPEMTVPHDEVVAWSESLGTANPLPRPVARIRMSE